MITSASFWCGHLPSLTKPSRTRVFDGWCAKFGLGWLTPTSQGQPHCGVIRTESAMYSGREQLALGIVNFHCIALPCPGLLISLEAAQSGLKMGGHHWYHAFPSSSSGRLCSSMNIDLLLFFLRVSMTEQLSGVVQKLAYWVLGSVFPRVRH